VALEVGYDQGAIVAGFLREAGLTNISIGNDLNGIPRFPLAQKA
jgi:hypothetical protein